MITWKYSSFANLTTAELYEIIKLREKVFVVEQECVYLDCDGFDYVALHLMGFQDSELIAYLRVLPPATAYEELSFGRVVTSPTARRRGHGRELTMEAMRILKADYPGEVLKISAQSYLEQFYSTLGFQFTGKKYLEDGIPHIEMKTKL
jgi:ElaA protein